MICVDLQYAGPNNYVINCEIGKLHNVRPASGRNMIEFWPKLQTFQVSSRLTPTFRHRPEAEISKVVGALTNENLANNFF